MSVLGESKLMYKKALNVATSQSKSVHTLKEIQSCMGMSLSLGLPVEPVCHMSQMLGVIKLLNVSF